MRLLTGLIFYICASPLLAQNQQIDLTGDWTTCDQDSLYYKADTLVMYQDANYNMQAKCCSYVNWKVESRKKIKIENLYACTEPGRVSSSTDKETYKVMNCDDGQMLVIKRGKLKIGEFRILSLEDKRVNRYPYNIKTLTLIRQ